MKKNFIFLLLISNFQLVAQIAKNEITTFSTGKGLSFDKNNISNVLNYNSYFINTNVFKEDEPTTLQKLRTLIALNLSADFSSKGNKLVYENDVLPATEINFVDYYLTFEVYLPVIRWQRTFLPLAKSIKKNQVNVNSSKYSNYTSTKFDMLGLLNIRRYIYLTKGNKANYLDKLALLGPFYKKTDINTADYSLNKKRYSVLIGALTYEESDETVLNTNYIIDANNVTNGSYKVKSNSIGLQIDEFYSNLQSYFVYKAKFFPDEVKKNFNFIPAPAVSFYKIDSEISYFDSNNTLIQTENYKGTGFTAGFGAILLYNHFGSEKKPNFGIYTRFYYVPWHNEGLKEGPANKEIYRDYNNDYGFNIGLIFLNI